MKIRKRLATPSGDLPLVYEDVRLELSAPGRAVFQVVSKEPVSGFVAFAMGYAVNGRDALVFAGYVERCTTMDGSQQRLMCREIAAKLEADIRRDFHKLMSSQSKIAARAAGRAVDVSADDFEG